MKYLACLVGLGERVNVLMKRGKDCELKNTLCKRTLLLRCKLTLHPSVQLGAAVVKNNKDTKYNICER